MIRRCVFILLAAFFAFTMAPAHATPDFMPVEEIRAGMRGIAKTVVSDNTIEEFGVEVIGIMKQKGPAGDLILVRTFGDVIERTGGIAQGMSGSPVYINNRLVGAIAYGWGLTDHKTGMVTPIGDMIKLWEIPDTLRDAKIIEQSAKETTGEATPAEKTEDKKEETKDKEPEEKDKKPEEDIKPIEPEKPDKDEPWQENEKPEEDVKNDENKIAEEQDETAEEGKTDIQVLRDDNGDSLLKFDDATLIMPQTTTLMASGFGDQAMALLKKELKPYGLALETGGSSTGTGNAEIAYRTPEPGSMVGVELIRGDVNLSSLGTVTYVQDGKILAFGHPFMKRGNVNYFLSEATVYTTLPGLENSFKIGFPGPAIGVVNQDRGAGIAGKLGVFPRIVPLRITVHDKTMGNTGQLSAQLAHDEDITPILSAATVFSAIEKTSDRVGSGTARVKFDITAQGLPVDELVRENMFYTGGNISELAISELFEAMAILTGNQYNPVNIIDVKIDVEVEKDRRTASIIGAKADKTTAKPGETVDVTVKLKPYRQEPINRKVSFTIPKDQPAGSMMVSVRGGGVASLNQLLKRMATETAAQESLAKLIMSSRPKPKTFEEAIKNLTERDRYNDVVLEILNMDIDTENSPDKQQNKEKNSGKPAISRNFGNNEADAEAKPGKPGKNDKKENQRKFNISTDYIVDSETQFAVEVVK